MDWRDLAGRGRGRRGYQFGDLSRLVTQQVRGRPAKGPKFKYAVLSASGTLRLYDPLDALRAETTTTRRPSTSTAARADAEHQISLALHGAAVRTLWAALPCADAAVVDECDYPTSRAAHAVKGGAGGDGGARRQGCRQQRPRAHSFTVASAAIGRQHPKTWRLAAHSLEDAEGWAAALAEEEHAGGGRLRRPARRRRHDACTSGGTAG